MCSPSTALQVNCLVIRHLYFRSLRGDLQEGHGCASRCEFLLFLCRSPFFPRTKSAFLCSSYRRRLRGCWPGGGKCGLGEEKSAHVLGLRAFTNCFAVRSAALPGVPPHHLLARKRRAGERRAGARRARKRRAGERKPGNESQGTKARKRRAGGFTGGRG